MALSENEKALLQKISDNKIEEVKLLLNENDVSVNCVDDSGMTPLQHAAYKGNYEMCKILIELGSDVNINEHNHSYTALMFAALGGHKRVVSLLLESGANVDAINSVGRNAAQMAGFVGQHDIVSIINNFIPRDELLYYTKIVGLETEPRLSQNLVSPLHSFIRQTNINPVRIGLTLKKSWSLVENGSKVVKVLELLCEKQLKKAEPFEMLALKFHYLAYLLSQILKYLNKNSKENDVAGDEKASESIATSKTFANLKQLDNLLKFWLKSNEENFPENMERFLRQCVREFPFRDCALFQQLVRTLSTVEIGQEPSAVTILSQTINGQKGFDEDAPACSACGEPDPDKKCSKCKSVTYCNQECQRLHWATHKLHCKEST